MQNILPMDKNYYELWCLLHQTGHVLYRARKKELSRYGISVMESEVLLILQVMGNKATPAAMSRWLLREAHSVSELLNRMEMRGLVRKTSDPDRKNMIRVSLTEKGQQAYHQSIRRKSIRQIAFLLSEEEQQQLRSCLKIIRAKGLKKLGIERKLPFP